uniref:Murine leukemia virus integrase C-terminal domain-containing protein n=1 Tax=Mola mola TaxID=94237 RepID=A0A3Q4AIE0_MOLML
MYAVQCTEECSDLYIGETKQPLHRRMAQHRRATSSGQDSAVSHLQTTHPNEPGIWVLIENLRRKHWNQERWRGPYQVILSTPTAVRITERDSWVHLSHYILYGRGYEQMEWICFSRPMDWPRSHCWPDLFPLGWSSGSSAKNHQDTLLSWYQLYTQQNKTWCQSKSILKRHDGRRWSWSSVTPYGLGAAT